MAHLLAVLAAEGAKKTLWDPTILGLLTVAAGVVLFCGSTYLLLATNLGGRLGFMISAAALSGIMVLMSSLWLVTQTPLNSPKGRTPLWNTVPCPKEGGTATKCAIVDSIGEAPANRVANIPHTDLEPLKADQFQQLRPAVEAALVKKKVVGDAKAPDQPYAIYTETSDVLTVVYDADATKASKLMTEVDDLRSKGKGAQADKLKAQAEALYKKSASNPAVLHEYIVGGDTKVLFWHHPKYAAVEFCHAAPVAKNPNFVPPKNGLPCDPNIKRQWLILEYDYGSIRLPPLMYLLLSSTLFATCLYALHTRELEQRRLARAAVAPVPA